MTSPPDDAATQPPAADPGDNGVDDGEGILPTLQTFLSEFGVLSSSATSPAQQQGASSLPSHSWKDIIFESSFDLSEERLRYMFNMLDSENAGRISYESLRRGLEMHSSSSHPTYHPAQEQHPMYLTESSFDHLVSLLDADKSLDITFEEFSEGLRYLMLRALFPFDSSSVDVQATIEMLDYDEQRLERRIVVHDDHETYTKEDKSESRASSEAAEAAAASMPIVQPISTTDFYFHDRPQWVQTRWINVSGAQSAVTLKRLAVRYMLHPLALEDALAPNHHRPKAEVYSNHYFIMIPIFCIDPPTDADYINDDLENRPRTLFAFLRIKLKNSLGNLIQKSSKKDNGYDDKPRIGKIRVQMTSLFVNIPKCDTVITYNAELYNPLGYRASLEKVTTSGVDDPTSSTPQHCWTRIYQALSKSYSKLRQYDGQYLTYALVDQAVDLLGPIVHAMRDELSRQEKILVATRYQSPVALKRVHNLRIQIEKVARKLKPFIRLLVHIIEDDAISAGPKVYLRDVLDNLEYHEEEVRQLIVDCQSMNDQSDKHQSNQMDRTLYTLTIVSAVFLPVQFLTGVWGMNFEDMPELSQPWGYKMFWGVASVVMGFMVITLNFGRI